MSIVSAAKSLYRRIAYPHACPVCGGSFHEFLPIDQSYQLELDQANSDLSLRQFETLNIEQYACPLCGTADRNRLAALALKGLIPHDPSFRLLDIAPAGSLTDHINTKYKINYRSADLQMEDVHEKIDIQDMAAYGTNCLNAILCSHVLEHVPDDALALKEFYRVLAPGGWALLSVPIYQGIAETLEEPSERHLSPQECCRRYGQSDHLRLYEKESFMARVRSAGFDVKRMDIHTFGPNSFRRFGLTPTSAVYLCTKKPA